MRYTNKDVLIGIEVLQLHHAFLCSGRVNIPSARLLCYLVEGAGPEVLGITVATLKNATWAGRAETRVERNRSGNG